MTPSQHQRELRANAVLWKIIELELGTPVRVLPSLKIPSQDWRRFILSGTSTATTTTTTTTNNNDNDNDNSNNTNNNNNNNNDT